MDIKKNILNIHKNQGDENIMNNYYNLCSISVKKIAKDDNIYFFILAEPKFKKESNIYKNPFESHIPVTLPIKCKYDEDNDNFIIDSNMYDYYKNNKYFIENFFTDSLDNIVNKIYHNKEIIDNTYFKKLNYSIVLEKIVYMLEEYGRPSLYNENITDHLEYFQFKKVNNSNNLINDQYQLFESDFNNDRNFDYYEHEYYKRYYILFSKKDYIVKIYDKIDNEYTDTTNDVVTFLNDWIQNLRYSEKEIKNKINLLKNETKYLDILYEDFNQYLNKFDNGFHQLINLHKNKNIKDDNKFYNEINLLSDLYIETIINDINSLPEFSMIPIIYPYENLFDVRIELSRYFDFCNGMKKMYKSFKPSLKITKKEYEKFKHLIEEFERDVFKLKYKD